VDEPPFIPGLSQGPCEPVGACGPQSDNEVALTLGRCPRVHNPQHLLQPSPGFQSLL